MKTDRIITGIAIYACVAVALGVAAATVAVNRAHSEEMTLKEMLEDSLMRTRQLADDVRAADARARGELGTAEMSAVPEQPEPSSPTGAASSGRKAGDR